MAALEAEKWLVEADSETGLEEVQEAKKSTTNGEVRVPEYRSNPLL